MKTGPQHTLVRLLLGLAALAICGTARAAAPVEQHFDPFVQKPATSPLGLFTLEGAAAGDGLEWLALRADYAHGLFQLVNADSHSLGSVIPDRLDAHLIGSWAYKRWFSIGADLPLTVYQRDGFNVVRNVVGKTFADSFFPPLPHTGFDDIRLVPKFALPFHKPFTLALIPEIRLRTGLDRGFLGDELGPIKGHAGPIFAPRAEGEATVWRLRVVGEVGYQLRGQEQYFNLIVGDELTFGAGAEYALPEVHAFQNWEVIAEFTGNTQVSRPFTFGAGDVYETAMDLSGGLRARLTHGVLVFGGVGTGLSKGGSGRELFRAFAGVGWEPPNSESTVPVSAQELDSDHDGIPDGLDRCPTRPGPEETDGCPDADLDGIPDDDDKCPNQPGPVENQGCPVEETIVKWEPPRLSLNAGINFETGSAVIKKDSLKVVDAVADFLKKTPAIKKLRVEGHTDNRGGEKLNLDLSKRRARAVLDRLVTDGIAREKLESEGYGFGHPVATNDTALGRAKNRRVDFTVLDPAPDEPNAPTIGRQQPEAKPGAKAEPARAAEPDKPAAPKPDAAKPPPKADPPKPGGK